VSSYAIERLVDQAAYELGIDPAELRRRNLVRKDQFPYRVVTGFEYDCGDFHGVLDKALKAADWNSFDQRKEEAKKRGKLRGRGIATYIEASSAGGFAPYDQVQLTWDEDARITLRATSHSHGQGHETTYAQIVSGVLGVPMERIRLRSADPDMNMVGNPTGGSRSLHGVGSVLLMASQEVVRKGLALAAEELEAAPADIEFVDGCYRIKGTDRRVDLGSLVKKHRGALDVDLRNQKVGGTFPNGCHIAEIEIEPETGVAEIVRYVGCDDAGNLINPQIVEGQMQGGITQGAGHIFGEQAIYARDSGQLLNGSFMDYPMPRAVLVNNLTLLPHPVPTSANPLGAKGVGEAGVTGSMPCLMNALMDALRQAGVKHFDMPATPQRLWSALRAASGHS
jgi:carbon-monoxide dehydrogenase large subunit